MNVEWLARASVHHNLTRLPNGVCCSMCGLVASTDPPEGDDDSSQSEEQLALRAWAEMEAHVRREHCAACCRCGKEAAGVVELMTGEIASWLRRSRMRSPLEALRAHRRVHARAPAARGRRATERRQQWQPRENDSFFRYYNFGAESSASPPPPPPPNSVSWRLGTQSQRCNHAVCVPCAQALAEAAAPILASTKILVKCPAEDCKGGIDSDILALFLPPESVLQPTFRCIACGEDRHEREKVPLHVPRRPTFQQLQYPRYRAGMRMTTRSPGENENEIPMLELDTLPPPGLSSENVRAVDTANAGNKRQRVDGNVASTSSKAAIVVAMPQPAEQHQRQQPIESSETTPLGEVVAAKQQDAQRTRDKSHRENSAVPTACEMCASCAKRWLAIQSRDGVACVRCPTPQCRATLSRETLELLLTPDGYKDHLNRTRKSFEARLQELRRAARSTSIATANAATIDAARSLEQASRMPPQSIAPAPSSSGDSQGGRVDGDDDGTLAFLRWAGDATRACPECHVIIYRSEGCSHMSCACGAEFNWDRAERILHDTPSVLAQSTQSSPIPPVDDVLTTDFFGDLDFMLLATANHTNNANNATSTLRTIPNNPAELRQALIVEQARTAALRDEIARTAMRRNEYSGRAVPVRDRLPRNQSRRFLI